MHRTGGREKKKKEANSCCELHITGKKKKNESCSHNDTCCFTNKQLAHHHSTAHSRETPLWERHCTNASKIDNAVAFVAGLAEDKKLKNVASPRSTEKPSRKQHCKTQHEAIILPTTGSAMTKGWPSPPVSLLCACRKAARGDDACRALSSVSMAVVARVVMLLLLLLLVPGRGLPRPTQPQPDGRRHTHTFTLSQRNPAHKNVSWLPWGGKVCVVTALP